MDFRGIFSLFDPDRVHEWVESFKLRMQNRQSIPISVVFAALDVMGHDVPEGLHVRVISGEIRRTRPEYAWVTGTDVANALSGLSVFSPNILQISSSGVITLGASLSTLRAELAKQLSGTRYARMFGLA